MEKGIRKANKFLLLPEFTVENLRVKNMINEEANTS